MKTFGRQAVCLCLSLFVGLISVSGSLAAEQDSLNNSTISNLVAGLLVEDSDSYTMNLDSVYKTLRTVRPSESEPLSQALLAKWEVLQDKRHIEKLLTATTNRFLEAMARNMYKARRQQQVQNCDKAISIILSLAAYERADDLRVYLEDIRAKPNGVNFHVDFEPWQVCGFWNGPYGALVSSVLRKGTEEHLRSLLDILGAERSPRRETMLMRFRRSSAEIRGKLTALVNKPEFKEIREEVIKAVSEAPAKSEGK